MARKSCGKMDRNPKKPLKITGKAVVVQAKDRRINSYTSVPD
jgi:hypothetical protein